MFGAIRARKICENNVLVLHMTADVIMEYPLVADFTVSWIVRFELDNHVETFVLHTYLGKASNESYL